MSSLRDKLIKNSTIKLTAPINESKIYGKNTLIQTSIPALNIAFSGMIDGGFSSGLTLFAGPSKCFKTLYTLIMAKAYMDKYPEAMLLFYDNEFGTPEAYFKALNIDTNRVIHTPFTDVEELKHDIANQLQGIERGDRIFIAVDSIGNAASRKEVRDAIDGKEVADLQRAKQIKSLFRIITPHLTIKDIPVVCVAHTYQTMEMFSRAVVSGGTGIYYSADNIFIIGRQQEKDSEGIAGYNFIINVEKSRHSREKSKIALQVLHKSGINRWSGLLDIALASGHVVKPKNGWYCKANPETGEVEEKNYRQKDTNCKDFWFSILQDESFREFVKNKFTVSANELISDEEDQELEEMSAGSDQEVE